MKATFLVEIDDIADVQDLPGLAADIHDSLDSDGYSVVSVEPWERPSLDGD